jgi:hypothetical protein
VLVLDQRLGVQADRRDGVVDVVRDATGHLPQCAQSFLLQDLLLRLAQVVVGALQRAVQMRLVRSQRGVLADLAQEFAFAAGKTLRRAPRAHQHAEHLALHQQRRDHHRAEPGAGQQLRKAELDRGDLGLVHQLAAHAARQPVLVDGYGGVMRQAEAGGGRGAARADAAHREAVGGGVAREKAAEVHRQFFFEALGDGAQDAAEVLALADGMRDPPQQRQAPQLLLHASFVRQALGDVAVVSDDGAHRRVVEQVGGHAFEPDPVAVLVAPAPGQGDR